MSEGMYTTDDMTGIIDCFHMEDSTRDSRRGYVSPQSKDLLMDQGN